ncbi:MAG: Fic family protein [Candidatus Manganitrophaceae bacterium]
MMRFLDNLDPDIRNGLIVQLRNFWTHTTTALEGNSLTLGETAFVIGEGLTIKGKPVKDHQEVIDHAKAIGLLYDLLRRNTAITEQDLFLLHKAVQTNVIVDIFKPVGAWKKEPNGTNAVINNQQVFIHFASPEDVPYLMKVWIGLLNSRMAENLSEMAALSAYVDLHVSFVRIHPFFEGNGRMARLLANVPVLKSGYPPIIIPNESRLEYIRFLSEYDFLVGMVKKGMPLLPEPDKLVEFKSFCENAWGATKLLVEQARREQQKRGKSK